MAQDRESRRGLRTKQASPKTRADRTPTAQHVEGHAWPGGTAELEQQALLTVSSEGMIVLAADGAVSGANQRAESMLGLIDGDFGRSIRDILARSLIAGTDGVPLSVESWPGLRGLRGETVHDLNVGLHRDGRTIWLSTCAVPIVLAGGAIGGAVVTMSDVTMLRALEQHHEQLIRLVSHDIRNPLTSVHLNAQLLEKCLAERGLEKELRLASVVIAAARRLDAMIEELVDSSRVRSGQLVLELRPVSIERVVPEILARNAGTFDTSRVRLALPKGPVRVTVDLARLERVITSLIIIALRNCVDGAEVALRVALVDDEVRFAVAIPGRVRAGEDSPSPPSSQFGQSGTDHGYGLGLFIARMLVERHGGRLWVEGAPNCGATFHFALPVGGPDD